MDTKAIISNLGKLADLAVQVIPQAQVGVEMGKLVIDTFEKVQATAKLPADSDEFATAKRQEVEAAITARVNATADRLKG